MTIGIMSLTWVSVFWANSENLLKLEVQNKKLSDLAQQGVLIGVYLMNVFKEKAQLLLDDLPNKFTIAYTDFSNSKYINDVFGYDYGDLLLFEYGAILQKGLREHELYGRVSTDNFALPLHCKDKNEIRKRQSKADLEVLQYMSTLHNGQLLPASCGICCVEDVVETLNIDRLLDRANFAGKTVRTGVNQDYACHDEDIRSHLWEEKDTENRVLTTIKNREFTVHYQPRVDLATGRIGRPEALVRWQSQSGTIIAPGRSVPAFERKHMIGRLGQYAYENVYRWLRSLLDSGVQVLPVSVNASRLQFYDQRFTDKYISICDKHPTPPQLLEIEFTEPMIFDSSTLLLQTAKRLKDAGFLCSIDDFRKGYSSLGFLKNLLIDVLRVDSFFFEEGPDQGRNPVLAEGIVSLVKKFNIRAVAGGIESIKQVEFLEGIGCDYIQDYMSYRPMLQQEYEAPLSDPVLQ